MPSVSKSQANFMKMVAASPSFAKSAKIPQKVGKDFAAADKAAGTKQLPARVKPMPSAKGRK